MTLDNFELSTIHYTLFYYIDNANLDEDEIEWLNECPVEIANYLDYTDTFEVTFRVPLENVAESITKEQLKSIKGNLL